METKLEQIAVKAVNQLPKSVVREIRTPRSVGAGGGRPPPATPVSFYILHDLQQLQIDPAVCGIDVVVSGHSHRPRIETIDGVLYLNPGSAGPRRFKLPITLATLELTASGLRPVIHDLSRAG
jgi:hypothetical protein